MDILMISGTHPAAPHVSGVRAGRFAAELARMGHRCVLMCPPMPEQAARDPSAFESHDWSAPYVVEAADPAPTGRGGVSTLIDMLRFGGRRRGFYRNLIARGRALSPHFTPQVGWATFGSLEGVFALRSLAREQGFAWIFDDKDNPEIYVPQIVRRPMAWRLRGYAAMQTNSVLHGDAAKRWLGDSAEVVYSGVDACFFAEPASTAPGQRYVTLVGSLYRREMVDEIVAGIADYNATSGRAPIGIVGFGWQGDWLTNDRGVRVESLGYISPVEMARICRNAVANCYVFLGRTFHHKLFELLACRRPVIAYGGELPESMAAADRLHAPLARPTTPSTLGEALAAAEEHVPDPRMPEHFFTWPEQAAMVEAAMRRIA